MQTKFHRMHRPHMNHPHATNSTADIGVDYQRIEKLAAGLVRELYVTFLGLSMEYRICRIQICKLQW